MYLRYFGLHENPFAISPDPRYLYLSPSHQEALAHLQYGLAQSGGFVQLTGEVGTGKTLLIRALGERLPKDVDVALVLYPVLTVTELIAAICDELRVPHPGEHASLKQLVDVLDDHLLQNHARGRRTMLIIDEAQNLSREVLEQIRLLTNLETTKQKLLQIILIGQPELERLLAQPDLRQLAQRITARHHLTPLTRDETRDYIVHRCRVAGARAQLFSLPAIHRVHALAGGTPRLINIICDRALLGAYAREKNVADVATVNRAAEEIGSPVKQVSKPAWRTLALITAALTFILVAAIWHWRSGWMPLLSSSARNVAVVAPQPAANADSAVSAPEIKPAAISPVASPAVATSPPTFSLTLSSLLSGFPELTDTESALKNLFSRWHLNYTNLVGGTGCERALNAGLHCIYKTGTWNNLRDYDRPAIVELQDATGHRHHVLVTELKTDSVALMVGGQQHEYPLSEVDRYWFGKYLLLWKPPMPEGLALHVGDRGNGVIWLRDALARYQGKPLAAESSDLFDKALQAQLREFQLRHQLVADGEAGRVTVAQLQNYLPGDSPSLLAKSLPREAH